MPYFGKSANAIVIRLLPTTARNETVIRIVDACPIAGGIKERHRKDALIHQDLAGVLGDLAPSGVISSNKGGKTAQSPMAIVHAICGGNLHIIRPFKCNLSIAF
jgi:hypothetical protein